MRSTQRKLLASIAVISALAALAGYGIFGAFSASAVNEGNKFSSATLELTSSNAVSAEPVYNKTNAVPGDSGNTPNSCIEITYSGTVPAEVRLYGDEIEAGSGLAPGIMLQVTEGTGGAADGCSSFTPSGSIGDVLGGGTGINIQSIRTFHGDWPGGVDLGTWGPGDSATFKFDTWLDPAVDPEAAQGADAGEQAFVWEARAGA